MVGKKVGCVRKLKFLLGVFVCLLSINFVLGATCVNEDDTILRLFSSTNAHAQVYNYDSSPNLNYSIGICYSDFFGGDVLPDGTVPHPDCSAFDDIVWLSDATNAHAADSNFFGAYGTKICYGDLTCNIKLNCAGDETNILRISSLTNAHLEEAGNSNYPWKICCKTGPRGNFIWANMHGNGINDAEVNDTVKMVAEGIGGVEGTFVTFEIYEDDLILDDKIRTVADGNELIGMIDANGDAVAKWTITDDDLAITAGDWDKFYFVVDGDTVNKKSGNLEIMGVEVNVFPITSIINPIWESNYTMVSGITEVIGFNQSSIDIDDDLNVEWRSERNLVAEFTNCSMPNVNCNTTYQYIDSGTKLITIYAREMSRDNVAINFSRIYIHKPGYNIFAIIDSPDYRNPFGSFGFMEVGGVSSYVAECFTTQVGCTDPDCYDVIDSAGGASLYCYRYAESDELIFEWKVDGVVSGRAPTNDSVWYYLFDEPKDYDINLKVTHLTLGSNETFVIININAGGIWCDKSDSSDYFWRDFRGYPTILNISEDDESYECMVDGNTCCAGACVDNECVYTTNSRCFQFGTQSQCEGGSKFAEASANDKDKVCGYLEDSQTSDPLCWDVNDCRCSWNATSNTCGVNVTTTNFCEGFDPIIKGSCVWGLKYWNDTCNLDGMIRAAWNVTTATGIYADDESTTPNDGCVEKFESITCEDIVKLPFFDFFNLIVSIVLISSIYFFNLSFNRKIKWIT